MALSKLPDGLDEDDDGDGILSEINITPLTDVFLVLLIIFMVATSAAVDEARQQAEQQEQAELQAQAEGASDADGSAGMEINLPRASTTAVLSSQAEVTIWVGKDGSIRVKDTAVDLAGLKQILQVAGAEDPDTLVVIRADTEIPHGRVVSLMDVVRREGLTHLAVATVTAATAAPSAPATPVP